ncbi:MAG: NifB/NifX family molybdenum-iron cluster-binding protein [Syntrophobacteraceae bacterium]|jgi:predicted Fe-Mo cluster-binding NifX family protein|nr:NifB/NifX family molybdenum-iron cluster-binding protein [Syntrophobacteraceae bacterium]
MRIAVSAGSPDMDAQVDPRFGRTTYFLVVDSETLDFEAVENKQNLQAVQGAGIQAATLVARSKAQAVLTGHCGPKAFKTLQAAGIPVVVGVRGTVREAVRSFSRGELSYASAPDVEGHWA